MGRVSARGRRVIAGTLSGAVLGLVAALVAYVRPGVVELLESSAYDVRVRGAAQDLVPPEDIAFIVVSDQAIADVEENLALSWPWPRPLFGYIAEYAASAGAKAVVFDWLFQDRRLVAEAEEFANALRTSGRSVIGLALDQKAAPPEGTQRPWGARLAEFPTRAAAEAAALTLLAWDTRVFVVGAGPSTVYYGGLPSAEAVWATWDRLANADELAPLFLGADGAPVEPAPVELPASVLSASLSAETLIRARDGFAVSEAAGAVPEYTHMDPPLAVIAAAPAHTGAVYQESDRDGVMRHYAPLVRYGDRLFPSLALAAYLVAHPDIKPELSDGELVLGERRVPLDDSGRLTILYYPQAQAGRATYPSHSAYSVLRSIAQLEEGEAPEVAPDALAGKYVFVSAAARSLRDLRPTPIAELQQGAEINANVLGNILRGEFIVRAARGTDAVLGFVLCVAAAFVVVFLWTAFSQVTVAIAATLGGAAFLLGGYWQMAVWTFEHSGTWIAVAAPAGGAAIASFGVLLVTTASERRSKRFVQEALGRYTSPALVRELTEHPEYLSLEWGETREMSVYFSDIAGFTTISESLEPEQLVALLNDYLTELTNIVLEHDGVVDKYIGDAIMAFWGAPVRDADHARKSVLCAIAMRDRIDELRPRWEQRFGKTVIARAGINTGEAVVGNMGSKHKYNYTVMGDMVNLAARLEGANKPYGTVLMISEFTKAKVEDDVDVRDLDLMAVKGKEQPVAVFEVLGRKGQSAETALQAVEVFHDGLARYRALDFAAAIERFEQALAIRPDDGPSKAYIERCKHFIEQPPPDDWDGVWRMKEK